MRQTRIRTRTNRRLLIALLAGVLVSSACSGGGFPGDDPTEVAIDPATNPDGSPSPGPSKGGKGKGGPSPTNGGDVGSGGGGDDGGGNGNGGGGGDGGGGDDDVPEADLFTADEDRIGITDDRITMCGHAALTYAAAFDTRPEDLNVYWQMVNAAGGVHGRRVEMTYEDDAYSPTEAIVAAEACYDKDPFILVGGIGFDQIPAVRTFAESHHMLYIHHVARQDLSKRYSFSALPTVEQLGKLAAQWIATQHRGKKVGALYRDSENWDPGYKTFVAELKRLKADFYGGSPVASDQRSYSTILNDFQENDVEVVFGWENALNGTNMVLQAKSQGYSPQWILFPFNLETDTLGDQALDPPIEGIAAWSAFSPGDFSGPFTSYADELRRFVNAYREYRPNVRKLTDLHWQVWLAWKTVHNLYEACGRDCTRNGIVGLLQAQRYGPEFTHPDCPIDFTRNGHVGGFAVNFFRAYDKGAGFAGWRPIEGFQCRESLV